MTIRLSDCEFSMYVCYIQYIHSTYVREIIEKIFDIDQPRLPPFFLSFLITPVLSFFKSRFVII